VNKALSLKGRRIRQASCPRRRAGSSQLAKHDDEGKHGRVAQLLRDVLHPVTVFIVLADNCRDGGGKDLTEQHHTLTPVGIGDWTLRFDQRCWYLNSIDATSLPK
jgi:hypothetical protein